MLTINTRNDKLAAARADFSSRGMLQGTCLGNALQLWHCDHDIGIEDNDNNDPGDDNGDDGNNNEDDGSGEGGSNGGGDLDGDDGGDRSSGPVDGPPVSEVVLALRKGKHFSSFCVEQRRVYFIYYYGTLTLPYKGRGERAVEAVAVRVDSGREQETLLFYIRYRLLYILSYKRDGHSCIA